MAASGFTPIQLYYSSTAATTPSASNLLAGELAINTNDGKLFYKDSGGSVQTLASKGTGSIGGSNTQIQFNNSGVLGGSANFTWNGSTVAITGALTATADSAFSSTGALQIPSGTTGQQPAGVAGKIRFNTTTVQFEGYNGTAWSTIGGGSAISNDTSTASYEYPLFAAATTGTPTTIYTSNAKYLYKPSTGDLQSTTFTANGCFFVNPQTLPASYTVPASYSAHSTGPITIPSGMSVTVSSGARWVVL
jgi:hypothetical protein